MAPTGNRADSPHNHSGKRLRQGLNIQAAAVALLAMSTPIAGRSEPPKISHITSRLGFYRLGW